MEASAVRAAVVTFALALALKPALVRGQREPDFDRMLQQQAETDKTWRAASDGFMQMDKITYRSKAGDLDVPAFVFQPVKLRGAKAHPAIVWVHENIRGHLYEHYIPYIREATAKGYLVIAPEYRGSIRRSTRRTATAACRPRSARSTRIARRCTASTSCRFRSTSASRAMMTT